MYVNWLLANVVLESWLVLQMVLDFECYCCVRSVNDISSVYDHYEFFVGFHSARYDDWNSMAMLSYSDWKCPLHHYTGTFRIRSMLRLVADDDCWGQQFASNVASDNVDAADWKLVHWFWFVEDLQSIKMYSISNCLFVLTFCLLHCYFLVLHSQFSMWHTLIFCFYLIYINTKHVWGYERAVQKKNTWNFTNQKNKRKWKKK